MEQKTFLDCIDAIKDFLSISFCVLKMKFCNIPIEYDTLEIRGEKFPKYMCEKCKEDVFILIYDCANDYVEIKKHKYCPACGRKNHWKLLEEFERIGKKYSCLEENE